MLKNAKQISVFGLYFSPNKSISYLSSSHVSKNSQLTYQHSGKALLLQKRIQQLSHTLPEAPNTVWLTVLVGNRDCKCPKKSVKLQHVFNAEVPTQRRMMLWLSLTTLCQKITLPCSREGLAPALSVIILHGHFNDLIKLLQWVLIPLLGSEVSFQTKIISGSEKFSPSVSFFFLFLFSLFSFFIFFNREGMSLLNLLGRKCKLF